MITAICFFEPIYDLNILNELSIFGKGTFALDTNLILSEICLF